MFYSKKEIRDLLETIAMLQDQIIHMEDYINGLEDRIFSLEMTKGKQQEDKIYE